MLPPDFTYLDYAAVGWYLACWIGYTIFADHSPYRRHSMTAVMGRMATYSGNLITWDVAVQSDLRLGPDRYAWDAEAPAKPEEDGSYAAAKPGVTKAW